MTLLLICLPLHGLSAGRGSPARPLPQSSEALALQSPWNRPETYPLALRPRRDLYRPSASWIGRLLLPSPDDLSESGAPGGDWVWIELEQAPPALQELIGRRLRLLWQETADLQDLVQAVSTDIRFGEPARRAAERGNVVPSRLNGRRQVGPLQSLAGARPIDDVTVLLESVLLQGDQLRIAAPPVQISGRWQALVRLEGQAPAEASGLWQVRHYNRASGGFDGESETIRIPQLPADRYGRQLFDPRGLDSSALNRQGWLIQGAPASDGVFTVQAIEPRALLMPAAERQLEGTAAGLAYLRRISWSPPLLRRGSLHSAVLRPDDAPPLRWQPGDRALLMHLFGGIGGSDGEPVEFGTVTGHFAFGEAQVVEDPFSGEPRLQLRYHQIYANNPNGIVAGSQDWSAYAGNLQRGWLGSRPFSDVLIPIHGAALDAIALQAELLAARYRSGDGQGVALVTAATSCVQDSIQALWIALQRLRPQRPQTGVGAAESERLQHLGEAIEHRLTPFGRVRRDWLHNGDLPLNGGPAPFQASQRLGDVLLSWRSVLPRGAHDDIATEVLRQGLPLQVLRTNQIPGVDPRLAPIAPTTLLGQLPLLGPALTRLGDALLPPQQESGWGLLVLALYAPLAYGLGRRSGFLPRRWCRPALRQLLPRAAGYLLMPAFVEELLFRGLLLPSPLEGTPAGVMGAWLALSTGLFVFYHPISARLWYAPGRALFDDPRFLGQCTLLGLACALAYGLSASLWWAVLIHWLAVLVWLEPLQGRLKLGS
ncbi:MAG: CPBP family glutamic-type intramembrane protease [Synechococcaceae cyanobacterium]|nr:CPBP family glutamic-type intramembrane protease [Synechococcaceae cyanobacterium]